MAIQIKKAVRERIWLKVATMGPSGAGKTYGSIALAKGLSPTGKVLVVDTENGSASYYADKWDFDVVDMHAPFTSQKYMEVLQEAVRLGYEAIVFDSMSHEWAASGGVLDKKADFDRAKGEKWGNWQDAKKPHSLFKEAWLQAPIHVVATMRSKMEYVLELNEKGKQVPRKVGLAPIQDGDSEYEFGVAFEIDRDSHLATAAKDRTGLFDGRSFTLGEAIGRELLTWRESGAPLTPDPTPATPPATATHATATPAATAVTRATTPRAQSVAQPVAQGAKAPTSQAPAVAARPTQAQVTPATAPSDLPAEWVAALVELAEVTLGMPEKTRAALVAGFEAEGPAKLAELLAEIKAMREVMQPEPTTAGEVFAQMPRPEGAPVPQEVSDFVDDLDPRLDPENGGISGVQYEALNKFIGAYGLNRDALRAYMFKAGHLLPGKNGPTLARMKAEEFDKLRTKLTNNDRAAGVETWSQRTVRIINTTPITPYQPIPAAS